MGQCTVHGNRYIGRMIRNFLSSNFQENKLKCDVIQIDDKMIFIQFFFSVFYENAFFFFSRISLHFKKFTTMPSEGKSSENIEIFNYFSE